MSNHHAPHHPDLHGRPVISEHLVAVLPASVTGTDEIAIWHVDNGFERPVNRYVLNGSPYLSLSELDRAFGHDTVKRGRILDAIQHLLA